MSKVASIRVMAAAALLALTSGCTGFGYHIGHEIDVGHASPIALETALADSTGAVRLYLHDGRELDGRARRIPGKHGGGDRLVIEKAKRWSGFASDPRAVVDTLEFGEIESVKPAPGWAPGVAIVGGIGLGLDYLALRLFWIPAFENLGEGPS